MHYMYFQQYITCKIKHNIWKITCKDNNTIHVKIKHCLVRLFREWFSYICTVMKYSRGFQEKLRKKGT